MAAPKPRLLYVSPAQFGYKPPIFNNCRYLAQHFEVSAITPDKGRDRRHLPEVKVRLVPGRRGFHRFSAFVRSAIRTTYESFDVVLVEEFPGSWTIPAFGSRAVYVLDIRTGSVAPKRWVRALIDTTIRCDALCYRHVCVISEGLRARLRLSPRRAHILPLGAVPIEIGEKDFRAGLRLLYVGTLTGRRIEDTVIGVHEAARRGIAITYDIVGDGWTDERSRLASLIERLGIGHSVHLHGFIHHDELRPLYERCNVGVSYVPRTPYYDVQPPTKTFEYLLAGMPVIATATSENV